MYDQEKILPYGNEGDKAEQVEDMFNDLAPTYDTLNHRLSWNIDKWWRKKAIRQLTTTKPQTILDIATGTGDLAILAAKMLRPKQITAIDIAEGMMEIGRRKVAKEGLDNVISFKREDCMALSFNDESFDAIITSFGIRNFADLDKGFAEMYRVLKKGGNLCMLELSHPVSFPMKQLYKIYAHTIMPFYGWLVSRNRSGYVYLRDTIEAFPQGEEMTRSLQRIGFSEVTFKRLTFGICTMYLVRK